jgi:hypothetical protein
MGREEIQAEKKAERRSTVDSWNNDLSVRLGWAETVLKQAGYCECGGSKIHGLSCYYIQDGEEEMEADRVRIRVSDHYAHPYRRDEASGLTQVDFNVRIDELISQEQVEEGTRQAIQDRNEFLLSESYTELCQEMEEYLREQGVKLEFPIR